MSGHYDEELGAGTEPAQGWKCPHCLGSAHHHSDAQGCERHAQDPGTRIQIGPTDV
ncbi:hypothetical protein HNQ51_001726 [Inhella inkyongensis]|uniref:Uncharacterized protein n=1 Tax=Inhella inkyongensis TaxID=392593 RepID=A0A840S4D1_9BURK|nr:hypothetical protein [Inhella inkyongensis]MBB5204412.1 hypothetical protein [Inhella inkyongensis]